jgi:membrane-bound acyltransferase YfiQ involved in biofilm formation
MGPRRRRDVCLFPVDWATAYDASSGSMSIDMISTMFLIWLIHAATGAVLFSPVLWFGRKRMVWRTWELLAVVVVPCAGLAHICSWVWRE